VFLTDGDKNTRGAEKGLVGRFTKLVHMEVLNTCGHFKLLEIEAGDPDLPNSMGV